MASVSPGNSSSDGRPERLESWKEIAAYLNRTVRTAQRWEQTESLPVHRHGHDKRDSVYALTAELDEWLGRRGTFEGSEHEAEPAPETVPARWSRRTKWLLTTSLVAIASTAAILWGYWTGSRPALPFAARDWVVLADFDNQTGDPLFDTALRRAFAISFGQSTHVNVVPRARMQAALRRMGKSADVRVDDAAGREICLRENANALITCGIARVGSRYLVVARLIDPRSGVVVKGYSEQAHEQGQILDALGKIAGQLRHDLGESLASISGTDEPLPQVTTPSLEALRAYAEGIALWNKGQHQQAVDLYGAALKKDPDFAMAHAALGSALLSHIFNRHNEGEEHCRNAVQLRDRITDRERMLVEAQCEASLGHFDRAVSAYQVYLAEYPDDFTARATFAYLHMTNERPVEAIAQYQEVLRVSPANSSALINIATALGMLGRPAEALPYYAKAFELEPQWLLTRNINHEYGFVLAASGNRAKASEVFGKALETPDLRASALRSLALLNMCEGKFRKAAELLREAKDASVGDISPSVRNRLYLAILLRGRGDRRAELVELSEAAEQLRKGEQPLVDFRARVGVLYARAGAVDQARQILNQVVARADRSSPSQSGEVHVLEGEIALAKGELPRAVEVLALALREAKHPIPLAALARAYDQAGEMEKAIASYENLIARGSRAIGWEPQQDWLEAHARLAELHLERGDKAAAAAAIAPLEELWNTADPDLPLAKRMARVRAALR